VGRRIRVPEVRVIGADGSQVGILQTHEALRMAEEAGLDLVEVSPRAVPPVCRIMDFGRFKYQESKKEKASRKHQSTVIIKEIKFRPKTDTHDLDFKLKHIRRFLGEGNKVRLMIVFRGREIVHPETGQAMLDTVFKNVMDIAAIEQKPSMEGRRMVMVLGTRAGVIRPATLSQPTGAAAPASGSAAGPASSVLRPTTQIGGGAEPQAPGSAESKA
jgi:translation initiation factor IF-3